MLQQRHQRAPIRTLDWVGTSMGGLIGLLIAGQPELPLPAPIRRLVLNDVGPAITWDSVARMQQYVGRYGRYADLAEAVEILEFKRQRWEAACRAADPKTTTTGAKRPRMPAK